MVNEYTLLDERYLGRINGVFNRLLYEIGYNGQQHDWYDIIVKESDRKTELICKKLGVKKGKEWMLVYEVVECGYILQFYHHALKTLEKKIGDFDEWKSVFLTPSKFENDGLLALIVGREIDRFYSQPCVKKKLGLELSKEDERKLAWEGF